MHERNLILMRHAKSDWSGDERDMIRPLAERGLRQAPDAGRWLNASVGPIDLAVVSPARRARSTWDLVSAQLDATPRTRIEDRLYAASDAELLDVVRELSDDVDTALLVGHNPGMENLATLLTSEPVVMPTSALAVIAISAPWSAAGRSPAALRASGRPPSN
jgi:phosphohistidine phosphatase